MSSNGVEVRDSNGNYLYYPPDSLTVNGTDTLGRAVYGGASYVDSNGNQRTVQVTTEAVTIQTNLCQYLGADTCGEYVRSGTLSWNVPHIITLPNGMTYTIEYVQGQYGQPSSMTLPTGGQISWTWYQPSGAGRSTLGPMVQQRTLTANGVSGTWQNSNESTPTLAPATITDPAGNQTVTAFTCPTGRYVDANMNGGGLDPPCYASSVKYYQGSAASGTLLKTVATAYTASGAMLPQTVTTTLNDANLVSKTYTTYDSIPIPLWTSDNFTWGNVTEHDEYDYGTGAAGALVRKTTMSYLHQSNSTYQTANIADRMAGKNVYDGNGNQLASTLFNYDDGGGNMVSDLGSAPNHDGTYSTSYLVRGNATRAGHWLNTNNSWLTTYNVFDDLGNLRSTTDPGGHITTYAYGDNFTFGSVARCVPSGVNTQAFVTTATNAVSQNSNDNYFDCTGLRAWEQDPNDIAANRHGADYQYDLMNRPLQINYPDGGQTKFYYGDNLNTFPAIYVNTQELLCNGAGSCAAGTTMWKQSWKAVDGLGRPARTESTNGETNINYEADQTDTCYDALGHKSFERYPYQGPGWPNMTYPCSNSSSSPGDTFAYDALDRPTTITNTDGSVVTTSYWGNWTTVTDQAGRSRKSKTDALGRLVEVCEPDPASGTLPTQGTCTYETDYQYDALGDLTRVDQKGGTTDSTQWRTRLFTYDSLGRLLTANNPETGTISYGYDADSSMTSKTAPNVNGGTGTIATTYSYDGLHRLTQRTFSNSGLIEAYSYDYNSIWGVPVDNPVGRLVFTQSYYSGNGSSTVGAIHSYDARGRVEFDQWVNQRASVPGLWFKFSYGYNLDGSLNSLTYPSGRKLSYSYPVSGTSNCATCASDRASAMVDAADGIHYVTAAHYTAWGALGSGVYGNTATFAGITLSNSFNNRMQPAFITASTPTNTILSLGYDFHLGNGTSGTDNGNVWMVANNRDTNRTVGYSYDYGNRLTAAQTWYSNQWGDSYVYDNWGNLYQKNLIGGKLTGENLQATVDKLTNRLQPLGYDAAGNMIQNGSTTYSYDGENRLISALGVTFDYDADGRRVQKSDGKLYWYGPNDEILAETNLSGALQEEFIFFNGERVARRDAANGNVHYYFGDHLNSTDLVTDALGTMSTCSGYSYPTGEEESDYYPFGGERVICDRGIGNNYKFAGKERDPETGLDEFGARYYNSALARFVTPDWAAKPTAVPYAKFGDPQTLNLYSYVENSPVNHADANGHCWPPSACAEAAMRGINNAQAWLQSKAEATGHPGLAADVTFNSGVARDLLNGVIGLGTVGKATGATMDNGTATQKAIAISSDLGKAGGIALMAAGPASALRAGATAESGGSIISRTAQEQANKGVEGLSQFMSDRQLAAYSADPAGGSRFLGTAVHDATTKALDSSFPGRFEYSRTGPDFVDRSTGEMIELTTPGQVASHAARPGYDGVSYATYTLPQN